MKTAYLIVLSVLFSISACAQIPVINGLSNLLNRPITPGKLPVQPLVDVIENGVVLRYVADPTNALATNRFLIGTNAVGRWKHDWNGYVDAFGVLPNDPTRSTINGTYLAEAAAFCKATGKPMKFGPGGFYYPGNLDVNDITLVSGAGKIGNQYETILYITSTNASAFTNFSTGGVIENMHIRTLYYSYAKQSTVGYGVHGASGSGAQRLSNLYIEGFPIGVGLSTFDSLIENVDVIAAKPFVVGGGGTQNTFLRCAARGNIVIAGLTNDTSITCASYTAGSTNFTVSDGTTIAVGDYIRVRDSTEYSNTIAYRFFHRKVTAKSGNDITINYPWALGFTNGRFEFALGGLGTSAFEGNTEATYVGCNAEYGSWQHIISNNSGPTAAMAVAGVLHIEGWVADAGAGANNYVFNGVNTSLSAQSVDMANITAFASAGMALAEGGTRGYVTILHLRDFDQYQAIPQFYAGAYSLTKTYSGALVVHDINNAGADILQRPVDGTQWRNTVNDFQFGKGGELVRVDGNGIGQAIWYGFTDTPTGGNFVQGDRIITANEALRVLSTGSFQTPAGSNSIRNGSSILVVDQAARGVLGRRTPVSLLVTNGTNVSLTHMIVKEQLRNSPDTTALTAAASVGGRMIQVSDASGIQQGDPGIVVEGSTFNDVTVARVASPYIFLTRPLTNAFTTSATFYTGVQMYSTATNDVAWQALQFSVPTFIKEIDYLNRQRSGGPSVTTGLTVEGGASGQPIFALERPGAGTNSFLVGSGQLRVRDESDDSTIATFTPSGSTDLFWTMGDPSGVAVPRGGTLQGQAATGTDVAARNMVIRPGSSTGAATPPAIELRGPVQRSSGTSAQSYAELLTLKQSGDDALSTFGSVTRQGIIAGADGSGTNAPATNLVIRAGRPTGNAVGGSIMFQGIYPGVSGTNSQTPVTMMRLRFPTSPDAVISNSPVYALRYDGTNYVEMSMVWTNEGGLWRQYWRN